MNPDVVFALLAGIAFLGFVLDALFDRIRIASILPLMLIGIVLVATGVVSAHEVQDLNEFIPYVSAITIAFILFSVGLEIRFGELARVVGRASAFTLGVQTVTGILLSVAAYEAFHWSLLFSFVFGFGLSGPSSVSVPALLKVVRVGGELRTTLLYESVFSDLLQLLVPLTLIGIYETGTTSVPALTGELLWTILGSAAAGVGAGILWLWILDKLRGFTSGYTWTLTITIVLATYALSDLIGFSAAITIFVFGLVLGNAFLLDAGQPVALSWRTSGLRRFLYDLRKRFRLTTGSLDIAHIQQVQREVSFFASSFFFVYLGLLFHAAGVTVVLVFLPLALAFVMLVVRFAFLPVLAGFWSPTPVARTAERTIVTFNISRGLAAAVVATIPLGLGIHIPNFLDAMFLGIFFSAVVSTVGIFLLYRPTPTEGGPAGPSGRLPERSTPEEPLPGAPATNGVPVPQRPPLPQPGRGGTGSGPSP